MIEEGEKAGQSYREHIQSTMKQGVEKLHPTTSVHPRINVYNELTRKN